MENSSSSKVLDIRKVILNMILKKVFILNNVLNVVDIRKNLVSRLLLRKKKKGLKWFLKVIFFLEKGYL
jgi:hypothetical protein